MRVSEMGRKAKEVVNIKISRNSDFRERIVRKNVFHF